ncbi:hypothetical protein ACSBR2_004475 [Camellia fascicularis]
MIERNQTNKFGPPIISECYIMWVLNYHLKSITQNDPITLGFNLKWVGEQLRNSYTTGRFSEEITQEKERIIFLFVPVMVTRGKDRGGTRVVKHVIHSQNHLIVEGKNLVKKHIKQGQGHEGGIFTVEAPLHVLNVQFPLRGFHLQFISFCIIQPRRLVFFHFCFGRFTDFANLGALSRTLCNLLRDRTLLLFLVLRLGASLSLR